MAGLFATESQWFDAQHRNAYQQYKFGVAQNRYQKTLSGVQHGFDQQDLLRQYADQRKGLAGNYVQAGRWGGGSYKQGLGQLLTDKGRDLARLARGYQLQNQGFAQTGNQLSDAFSMQEQNLNEQAIALKKHLNAVEWAAKINANKNGA